MIILCSVEFLLSFHNLDGNLFNYRKIKTAKRCKTFDGHHIEIEPNIQAMHHCFFINEKPICWHDIYSTKIFVNKLTNTFYLLTGKSQIINKMVFLNETLFEVLLFHNETSFQWICNVSFFLIYSPFPKLNAILC